MKEYQLFEAIGGVEDRFLQELEESSVRHLPRRFGLVAALIALMLTACAAPVVVRNLSALKEASIVRTEEDIDLEQLHKEQHGGSVEFLGPSVLYMSEKVAMEVETAEELPQTMETYYLPVKLLEACRVENWSVDDTVLRVELSMETTSLRDLRPNVYVYRQPMQVYGLVYQQQLLPEDGRVESEGVLGIGMWDQRETAYGEISAVEFDGKWTVDAQDLETGELIRGRINSRIRHIFWSDGVYLYGLRLVSVPPLNTELKMQDILGSMTAVEDLSQYLPETE